MKLDSITIREVIGTNGKELEVVCDGHTTGELCMDEALGSVASWLYADKRDSERSPQYMNTYLHDARYRRRYGMPLYTAHALALRAVNEGLTRCGACLAKDMGEAVGTCCACAGKGWVG